MNTSKKPVLIGPQIDVTLMERKQNREGLL